MAGHYRCLTVRPNSVPVFPLRRFFCSLVEVENVGKKKLRLTQSPYARMADGAAVGSLGDTSVLVVAVSKSETRAPLSFHPLTVDYRQKAAAAGRIPTNHLRRELGPSEKEILTGRLIDRSIRPLFPTGYNFDTQVTCNLLAIDSENDPDVVSLNAASASLALSNIPWNGPLGAVRVGLVDGNLVLNPSRKERASSKLDLIISAVENSNVVMMEGSADGILLPDLQKAITFGTKGCMEVVKAIKKLQKSVGKEKRSFSPPEDVSAEILEAAFSICGNRLREIYTDSTFDKVGRDIAASEVRADGVSKLAESFPDVLPNVFTQAVSQVSKDVFRNLIFERKLRCDGRGLEDLRNISCSINLYPSLHGSALFQRGQTQVLSTLSFDSPASALRMDLLSAITTGSKEKNFFLHYEFPQYATNDLSRGPVGRRELGHGALAEKGLRPLIPKDFPYAIRVTAEVLESNGSSSMASVCAGSLALMDAGVQIPGHAAGVAIGLVTRDKNDETEYLLLTDLLGLEDYMGDMDFKLAGTKMGFTALQLDLKIPGIPTNIVSDALKKAADAKSRILGIMSDTIPRPRETKKPNAPVLETYEVPAHKVGKFLGVGGSNLKRIAVETGVQIHHVEETTYQIFAPNGVALEEAKALIRASLESSREPELEFGAIYTSKVVEVRDSGVLVQLYPTMSPTLIHNSQLDRRKVSHPSALGIEVGQELKVKYFGRDPVSGAMRLSRKVLTSMPGATVQRNYNEPRDGSKMAVTSEKAGI